MIHGIPLVSFPLVLVPHHAYPSRPSMLCFTISLTIPFQSGLSRILFPYCVGSIGICILLPLPLPSSISATGDVGFQPSGHLCLSISVTILSTRNCPASSFPAVTNQLGNVLCFPCRSHSNDARRTREGPPLSSDKILTIPNNRARSCQDRNVAGGQEGLLCCLAK